MRSLIAKGKRRDEILDLTAPAKQADGLVSRWVRMSLSSKKPEPAELLKQDDKESAA
jgi:hypothetical protein